MIVTVDSKWLLSHLDDPNLIIIDARGSIPYSIGHIRNALSLAVERVISVASNGANLVIDAPIAEEVFSSLGIDDNKIVVIYGEHINPSAARIAWTLMYHGHPNVKLLDVGLDQWQKYGLPVTRQISNQNKQLNKNVLFKSKINSMIRADADMIKAKQQQNHSSAVIVDARTPIEHMQARIPGSILDNWEEGLGPNDETMKSKEELEMDFEEKKQISKDKEIICYCHSGARASHKYLQFRLAGYNNVKVYDGSIIDWAQRHNPIR